MMLLGAGLALAIGLRATFTTVEVRGPSMMPTLLPGQHLLASRLPVFTGAIHDGDIVVVDDWMGSGMLIKRVYRTGNESVDLVNRPLYLTVAQRIKPFSVPEGDVYLLGDNTLMSEDSRIFGPVPADHIIAKVFTSN